MTPAATALRRLGRRPVETAAVVVTIGLTVTLSTAVFTVADGLVFRPLPYPNAESVVHLHAPVARFRMRPEMAMRLQTQVADTPSLTNRTWFGQLRTFRDDSPAAAEWGLVPVFVSEEFFALLGVHPAIGRSFVEADARASPTPVLLSHDVWRARFDARGDILGRTIDVPGLRTGESWQVVGVMPEGFSFPLAANVWLPRDPDRFLPTLVPDYARLRPGVSIDQLRAELPDVEITSLRDHVRPDAGLAFACVWVGTLLLVLLGGLQVRHLLAVQFVQRMPEIELRLALGASVARLRSDLLLEHVLRAGAAVAMATLLAGPATRLLVARLAGPTTVGQAIAPDVRSLVVAAMLAFAAVSMCAAGPILQIGRASIARAPRGDQRDEPASQRLNRASVPLQVGLTAMVLYGAGLVAQSFVTVTSRDLGFDPAGLYAVPLPALDLARGLPRDQSAALQFAHAGRLEASLVPVRSAAGVVDAAFASVWPLSPAGGLESVRVGSSRDAWIDITRTSVAPGYVRVIGARLVDGREPSPEETQWTPGDRSRAAVVNRTLAEMLDDFGPVVGQTLAPSPGMTYRITGVVEDIASWEIGKRVPAAYLYVPVASQIVLFRAETDAAPAQVMRALRDVWGPLAPRRIVSLTDIARENSADYRMMAGLVSMVGGLSLPIAGFGLIATMAVHVHRLRRPLAIMLALGASPARLMRGLVTRVLGAAAIGIAAGIGGGILAGRAMSSFIWGVSPLDVSAIAGVTMAAFAVAAIASWVPASRVTRLDPARLLR